MWGILRKASKSTATLGAPLGEHVKAFEARGEDLTASVCREFIETQKHLVQYRVDKFKAETSAFRAGGGVSLATLSSKDGVCFIRNVTRVLMAFMLGVMMGRNSYFPLLDPSSPFVDSLKYENPNRVPKRYQSACVAEDCE